MLAAPARGRAASRRSVAARRGARRRGAARRRRRRARSRARPPRSARAASARTVSTSTRRPGLGVDERQAAHGPAARLARIADLDASTRVARAERAHRRCASRVAAEVGDDDDEAARWRASRPTRSQRRARGRGVGGAVGRDALGEQRRSEADVACGPPRGGSGRARRRRRSARASAPAVAGGERGRATSGDALGDVGLQPVGGAEAPSRRTGRATSQVVSVALGHLQAHVGDAGAGAGGGVELAHVVAELVGPQLRELGARCRRRARGRSPGSGPAPRRASDSVQRVDERAPASARGPGARAGRAAWRRRGHHAAASRRSRGAAVDARCGLAPARRAPGRGCRRR